MTRKYPRQADGISMPGFLPETAVCYVCGAPYKIADGHNCPRLRGGDSLPVLFLASARELDWQDYAACQYTDPDLFYREQGASICAPKRVCAGCEVRAQCLEYAVENNEAFGVWGGMSAEERLPLRVARHGITDTAAAGRRAELDARARAAHPDGLKRCARCKTSRPLAAFSYRSGSADGLNSGCRACRPLERAPLGRAA